MSGSPTATVVAIDGPAASGKTSVGEALAAELGYLFLDTGLMYRAFTLAALRAGVGPAEPDACARLARELELEVKTGATTRILLGGVDVTGELRGPGVESNVSAYSAIAEVRAEMVRRQREIAAGGRAILAGRDIGTVVLPEAPLKLFLTASEDARTERREHQAAGWGARSTTARDDITGRDRVDSARAVSPLQPARDAVIIDTTEMALGDVIAEAMRQVRCAGLA